MAITLGGTALGTAQIALPLVTSPLTPDQVAFRVDRLKDDATTCWSCMARAASLARRRHALMTVLMDAAHRDHPERREYLRRCVQIELDMRQTLVSAASVERWADTTWHALTPAQRTGPAAEAWDVAPTCESLCAVVWTVWPPFSWPEGFAWEDEVGHLGSMDIALWLQATGKSPPNPPRLGPALQLAIDEGMNV